MNDDERKILHEVRDLLKWVLMAFVIVAVCFTISSVTMAVTWSRTLQNLSNDYFYSDYETVPSIEQSVDVRSGD